MNVLRMNFLRITCGSAALVMMLAGCASESEPPSQSSGTFGPPSVMQGIGPHTGMTSFKATGGWGPGSTGSSQPSMPADWNGSFRGY